MAKPPRVTYTVGLEAMTLGPMGSKYGKPSGDVAKESGNDETLIATLAEKADGRSAVNFKTVFDCKSQNDSSTISNEFSSTR